MHNPLHNRYLVFILLFVIALACGELYLGLHGHYKSGWLMPGWLFAAWLLYRLSGGRGNRSWLQLYLDSKEGLPLSWKIVILAIILFLLIWLLGFSPYSTMMRELLNHTWA